MRKTLEIENITFFEKDSDNEVCIETHDYYNNTTTFAYLNQKQIEQLIEFLQKQIV